MKTSGEVHVVRGSALHYFTHSARVFAFLHKPSIWTRLGGGGGGKVKSNLLFVHRILNFLSIATDVLFCILPC